MLFHGEFLQVRRNEICRRFVCLKNGSVELSMLNWEDRKFVESMRKNKLHEVKKMISKCWPSFELVMDIASLFPEVVPVILSNLLIVTEWFLYHHENLRKQNVTLCRFDWFALLQGDSCFSEMRLWQRKGSVGALDCCNGFGVLYINTDDGIIGHNYLFISLVLFVAT